MFNNLNNQGASKGGSVDDIFAETDKETGLNSSVEIEARRVGLASSEINSAPANQVSNNIGFPEDELSKKMLEDDSSLNQKPNKGYLRIIVIVICLTVLGAAGYFAYLQFFNTETISPIASSTNTNNIDAPIAATNTESGFLDVVPEAVINAEELEIADKLGEETQINNGPDSSLDTSNEENEDISAPSVTESEFEPIIDSDGDGLSDAEEMILGTNINLIDTDDDGLSDYDEVKIHHTDPLNPDTDGDGHSDGVEVRGGYDPNAAGGAKLPGNVI